MDESARIYVTSNVCCLLELLLWFSHWKVGYTGEYSEYRRYGQNCSDMFLIYVEFYHQILFQD